MSSFSWKNNVTIAISEKNFELFANECVFQNIILSNIKKEGECFVLSISFENFKKIRPLVRKAGVKVKILKKDGAGYFVRLHRKRYGFYLGSAMALLIFVYLTSCIWVVDVVGNEYTSKEEILDVMKKNGIAIGEFRYGKKLSEIKNNSLIELDTLSWLWVTIDGTRAIVEVRERGDKENIVDKTKPCNLVASYSGVIEDMCVKSGRKVIERGMVVNKGDLLVSGITETAYRQNRYIRSDGTVTARTWRSMEGEFSHIKRNSIKTGNTERKTTINIFGTEIKLYFKRKPDFEKYISSTEQKNVKLLKNIYLPITFTTEEFCEIIVEEETLTDSEVVAEATEKLTSEIKKERSKGASTVKRTYGYDTLPNGNLHVSVTLESLENIAKTIPIDIQKTEENTFGESN